MRIALRCRARFDEMTSVSELRARLPPHHGRTTADKPRRTIEQSSSALDRGRDIRTLDGAAPSSFHRRRRRSPETRGTRPRVGQIRRVRAVLLMPTRAALLSDDLREPRHGLVADYRSPHKQVGQQGSKATISRAS